MDGLSELQCRMVAVLSPIFSLDLQTCCTGIFHITLALT